MFGKNIKPEETSVRQNPEQIEGSGNVESIIQSIMRFTGAQDLEELEEIVKSVEQTSQKDKKGEEEKLFQALSTIKNDRSIFDAKEMEKNDDFVKAVLAGFEPEKAYMLANCEKLLEEAYAEGEKQGKESVNARRDRIEEVGMKVSGGYKAEVDPGKMTMEELKKIKEKLRKGELVRL